MTTKKPPAAASKRPQKAAKPTAKAKVPAATKKAPERVLVRAKTVAKASTEKQFVMPMEIKDWIDRAHSTMNHQRGEIERLKAEIGRAHV